MAVMIVMLEATQAEEGQRQHAVGSAHWYAPVVEQTRGNPVEESAESIARGASIFQRHCVNCHGASGSGDGAAADDLKVKPADLAIMAGMHTDGDFAWNRINN